MKMEDHHHDDNHNHHHQQQHEYGMPDLRQLMNGRGSSTHFQGIPGAAAAELFPGHRNLAPHGHHYELLMAGRQVSELMPCGLQDFTSAAANNNISTSVPVTTSVSTPSLGGLEAEAAASFGGDGGTGRWPRQETLTLLEIRSRLDSKFKEAIQKGPLWDEVSSIMSEEHGYQRSGKKCREKFENLYKYYKKTKEGKAGRQDGKNYRFFRQLEALYGETRNSVSVPNTRLVGSSLRFHTANNNSTQANQEAFHSQKFCDSLSLSNSSEFNSSSSDDNDLSALENDSTEKRRKRRGGRTWKMKIKEFIDSQIRKLMERQEVWLEKLTKTLEEREQERILRDEEWRRQEDARIDREHKCWAKERSWIEARDAALIEALQNLTGRQFKASSPEDLMAAEVQNHSENQNENGSEALINNDGWTESEVKRLMQLRSSMEPKFQQSGCSQDQVVWEEIATKMTCLGYDRNALMCKDKWDGISHSPRKTKEYSKKRKENSRSCSGYLRSNINESVYNQGGGPYCEINEQRPETVRLQPNDSCSSPASNSNVGNAVVNDSCFRFLMADGDHLWENYGLKLSKGENHQ